MSAKEEDSGGDNVKPWPLTHRVIVGAYIFRDERVLLIKRVNAPFTFAPPGGKLEPEEDPVAGLRREVREETGLEITILGVAHHWYGSIDGRAPLMLGLDFLAEPSGGEFRLSAEHTDYVWASAEDIRRGDVPTLDAEGYGYHPRFILAAFEAYRRRCAEREAQ